MKNIYKKNRGFTLLELLIVMSIFVIMTTVLVANQRKFGNNITIENVAQSMALSIREAQAYGLGSKNSNNTGTALFNSPYGVSIDLTKPSQYILFSDNSNSATGGKSGYDTSIDSHGFKDVPIETATFPSTVSLYKFCVFQGVSTVPACSTSADNLSITFIRPNPAAVIILNLTPTPYSKAVICLKSSQTDGPRKITVQASGQIEVEDVAVTGDTCN